VDNPIPSLVQGHNKFYCPQFCGVKWEGRGRRRARKLRRRFELHYQRRHVQDGD